ncbi:TPA: peptide chain release factor N(5)-glutamine methyltransferase [Cronobacter sakazakii]|uniref:peptide chain release factor N(5)-glutamine methyltransferase n=1 Tax=Cronobacter sakazakii TaxID=28141 RepID=UPI0004A98804|nr:peptide chain release factor N(5)-glutamine methyltransferase [Cronobacter sakazakii]EGT5204958.1 peptide chain release factor N(5)-glutamine methyltransferase [Cronobacter sakazakii]EGT5650657.1 peptide chain release factor N(5)-glutamine methyltransferase [Cronobacter sakazakii]EGT5747799.1 peptide chain release factor N(5)-glutamine methyltransferase [Cronobacter sakazakii]EGT5752112.1 peptide chain release factor N(5)-glutamine methyltransferase [Cronobacter sakazakii]EIZ2180259.1 pepti
MEYQQWLKQAIDRLTASESPRRDAEILLAFVTGRTRTFILAFGETALTDDELTRLDALLARRAAGEPVAYLIGQREFWSLPLEVSPATLIPRPDTECLVEQALARLPATPCRILDLGTGTGAIALALASERPDCHVTALDVIPEAVALAKRNAQRLGIDNVTILQSHWFSALTDARFSLIVSNPPYIDGDDPHLSQGDVRFEPKSALVADNAGLADLETLVTEARRFLEDNGWLMLEHGWQQGEAVRELFTRAGYQAVETCRDYGGNERLTLGHYRRIATYRSKAAWPLILQ